MACPPFSVAAAILSTASVSAGFVAPVPPGSAPGFVATTPDSERAEAVRLADERWAGGQTPQMHPGAIRAAEWSIASDYLLLSPAQEAAWQNVREEILLELDRRFSDDRAALIALKASAQGRQGPRFPEFENALEADARLRQTIWAVHDTHIRAFGALLSDEQVRRLDAWIGFLERTHLRSHLIWGGMSAAWPDVEHLALEFLANHIEANDDGSRAVIDQLLVEYRERRPSLLRRYLQCSGDAMVANGRAFERAMGMEAGTRTFDPDGRSLEAHKRLLRVEQSLADLNHRTVNTLLGMFFDDQRTAFEFEYAWFAVAKPRVLRHLPSPPAFYAILDSVDLPEDRAKTLALEIETAYTEMMLETRRISEALREGYETIAYRRQTSAADNEDIARVGKQVCMLVERRIERTIVLGERLLQEAADAGVGPAHPELQSVRFLVDELKATLERMQDKPCRTGEYQNFS